MDCSLIEGELIPFHFGTLTGERRQALEQHLFGCAKCLQAFLEVKRAIESGQDLRPKPSNALRARLRADVAAEFVQPKRGRGWMGAAAAVLVGATLVGVYVGRRPTPAETQKPAVEVRADNGIDTARPVDAEPRFF